MYLVGPHTVLTSKPLFGRFPRISSVICVILINHLFQLSSPCNQAASRFHRYHGNLHVDNQGSNHQLKQSAFLVSLSILSFYEMGVCFVMRVCICVCLCMFAYARTYAAYSLMFLCVCLFLFLVFLDIINATVKCLSNCILHLEMNGRPLTLLAYVISQTVVIA